MEHPEIEEYELPVPNFLPLVCLISSRWEMNPEAGCHMWHDRMEIFHPLEIEGDKKAAWFRSKASSV
jgi:hypothetical protein